MKKLNKQKEIKKILSSHPVLKKINLSEFDFLDDKNIVERFQDFIYMKMGEIDFSKNAKKYLDELNEIDRRDMKRNAELFYGYNSPLLTPENIVQVNKEQELNEDYERNFSDLINEILEIEQ